MADVEELPSGAPEMEATTPPSHSPEPSPDTDAVHNGGDDAYSSQRALAAIHIRLTPAGSAAATAAVEASAPAAAAAAVPGAPALDLPWLHLLPVRIAHTGPAHVPNYWQPTHSAAPAAGLAWGTDGKLVDQSQIDSYDASFRGRQMTGAVVQLPATAKGFLFEEDESAAATAASSEDAEGEASKPAQTQWKTSGTFSSLVLWQPDQELFERKHVRETLEEWIPIAHAIHDPIEA